MSPALFPDVRSRNDVQRLSVGRALIGEIAVVEGEDGLESQLLQAPPSCYNHGRPIQVVPFLGEASTMNGNPPEGKSANEDKREQASLLRLEEERDRLNQEVARLRAERDQLARALLTLLPAEPALPEEQILAQLSQLDKEPPLQEFVREVFKEVGG